VGIVEGVGVVEGVVSDLLRSKGEGWEPRTPSFQTRLTPLLVHEKFYFLTSEEMGEEIFRFP
jgi:hypothetical protein